MKQSFAFFTDMDNTLLDNDGVKREIRRSLGKALGETQAEHFWKHHDAFRERAKLVDFPAIAREFCRESDPGSCDVRVSAIFNGIDFAAALYPGALKAVEHLRRLGPIFVFSEGDMVYQRQKIENSGIAAAVDQVLLYEHKLDHLNEVLTLCSGGTPVFIDDKDDTLAEIKRRVPRAITIVVCQGHYARENCNIEHGADLVADSIADIAEFQAADFTFDHSDGPGTAYPRANKTRSNRPRSA